MQPTLNQGDLVIATCTERLDLIQPKHVYVVVAHDRIMVKRLRGPVKRNEPIELLSDNRFYDPFILPQNDLKELWQVQACSRAACQPTPTRPLTGCWCCWKCWPTTRRNCAAFCWI